MAVILHSDLNNFYASVECLYDPTLKTKAVAVCGDSDLRHGIVLAKNMIAKSYGVKTGDQVWVAKNKCPNIVIIKANFDRYLDFSKKVKNIYTDYTDYIESFGIDEAWLDITKSLKLYGGSENIIEAIRNRIRKELGVTVSIGVSFNKIFAKLGSDMKKPDGVTYITENNFKDLVWKLPASDLLYVERATTAKFKRYGIYTIGDIACSDIDDLRFKLGKWGEILYIYANGLDNSPVSKYGSSTLVKSIGNSNTAPKDLENFNEAQSLIYVLAESVATRLREENLSCKGVSLSVKDSEFNYYELQAKLDNPVNTAKKIADVAYILLKQSYKWEKGIRSLGVRAINLIADSDIQLSFLPEHIYNYKISKAEQCIDYLHNRFGYDSITRGIIFKDKEIKNMNPYSENTIHPVSFFKS
jgi:DNA polymerase-4